MKAKKLFNMLLTLIIFGGAILPAKADAVQEGEKIFKARCSACHSIDKKLVGPALKGLSDRRSQDWIIKFVRGSQALIKSGDKDAVAIFNEFNKAAMPDHPDLTDEHIIQIIAFVNATGSQPAADIGNPLNIKKPIVKQPVKVLPAYIKQNPGMWTAIMAAIILLIGVFYMIVVTGEIKK